MSKSRGPNFQLDEDKALCQAWLNTSGDGGTGTNQTGDDFYKRVKVTFDAELRAKDKWVAERNYRSLSNRFSTISHDVSKFVACHAKVSALEPSGCTQTDIEHQAIELYESAKKNGNFRFVQGWCILKDAPKWGAWRARKEAKQTPTKQRPVDKASSAPCGEDNVAQATSSGQRPVGQKRVKLEESNLSLYARQAKAAERMALNEEARNRVAREQVDLNIFNLQDFRQPNLLR